MATLAKERIHHSLRLTTGKTRVGPCEFFEKLRAQATSSKFQTPTSTETPSSKLKTDLRAVCPASILGVWSLRIGSSLELGIWCLVFRPVAAKKLRLPCARAGCFAR